jgi:hypothetical protein
MPVEEERSAILSDFIGLVQFVDPVSNELQSKRSCNMRIAKKISIATH